MKDDYHYKKAKNLLVKAEGTDNEETQRLISLAQAHMDMHRALQPTPKQQPPYIYTTNTPSIPNPPYQVTSNWGEGHRTSMGDVVD